MTITPITTHETDALARLLQQYKGSTNLRAILSAFVGQVQELEDVLNDLPDTRSIDTATGASLDKIGGTVGMPRPLGTDDDVYRVLILGRIGLNISQGETERVIGMYSLFTQSDAVQMQEYQPASISLMSDGAIVPGVEDMLGEFLEAVTAAGVAVLYFGLHDPTNPFVFAGGIGGGFGDVGDTAVGGKLAYLIT